MERSSDNPSSPEGNHQPAVGARDQPCSGRTYGTIVAVTVASGLAASLLLALAIKQLLPFPGWSILRWMSIALYLPAALLVLYQITGIGIGRLAVAIHPDYVALAVTVLAGAITMGAGLYEVQPGRNLHTGLLAAVIFVVAAGVVGWLAQSIQRPQTMCGLVPWVSVLKFFALMCIAFAMAHVAGVRVGLRLSLPWVGLLMAISWGMALGSMMRTFKQFHRQLARRTGANILLAMAIALTATALAYR